MKFSGTELIITPNGEGALQGHVVADGAVTHILGLAGGMVGGRASIAVVVKSKDGREVLGQLSLRLFLEAADIMKAAHGDPRL
jgi:formylmethanofuran dehydrogenase subunit C